MKAPTSIASWTERLIGLPTDEVEAALTRVADMGVAHVAAQLLGGDIDGAAGAWMLSEAFDRLEDHGIPLVRLQKKLRSDPGSFWSTWAEFRIASILLRGLFADAEVRLEEGKSAGAQADFRFVGIDSELGDSVEVKAVGLSDDELAFCQRARTVLPRVLPGKQGLVHVHGYVDGAMPRDLTEIRRQATRTAEEHARQMPGFPTGLRGAVIVGRHSEQSYLRRAARKVASAVRQLPDDGDACWVALYWSNGAPMDAVLASIDWSEIPSRVNGILIVGSGVAFPDRRLHVFQAALSREGADSSETVQVQSLETEKQELAELVFARFERSAGVRPTLLQIGRRTLVSRMGQRAIDPYNLLLDADPDPVARVRGAPQGGA
jgi:hypothetical protein